MPAQVIFFTPKGVGSIHSPGAGSIRCREAVTAPGVTANTVREGEAVVVYNGDAGAVLIAHGITPDAALTEETAESSCGFPVPAYQASVPLVAAVGAKISVKAVP